MQALDEDEKGYTQMTIPKYRKEFNRPNFGLAGHRHYY